MNDNKNAESEKTKKFSLKKWGLIGAGLSLALFIWYGFQPLQGSIHVGICKSFIDLHVRYPSTVTITDAYVFEKSQRLTYTYADPFGHFQSSRIDCRFKYPIGSQNLELERITIDRRPVPPETIVEFNASIPAIIAANPDLTIPFPQDPDAPLITLKRD